MKFRFKQFLLENVIQRTTALKQQAELIDQGYKVTVTKLGKEFGNIYQLEYYVPSMRAPMSKKKKKYLFCAQDGTVHGSSHDITDVCCDPNDSLHFARYVIKAPFPAGEHAISESAYHAYLYARDVLKGPFRAGERIISRSNYSTLYDEFIASLKPASP